MQRGVFETGKVGVRAACHHQNQPVATRTESLRGLYSDSQRSEKTPGYLLSNILLTSPSKRLFSETFEEKKGWVKGLGKG